MLFKCQKYLTFRPLFVGYFPCTLREIFMLYGIIRETMFKICIQKRRKLSPLYLVNFMRFIAQVVGGGGGNARF